MPSQETLTVTPAAARRFLIHAFALEAFQSLPDVSTAVERLEFVQEDSINVCGRIHDLILWARVRDYVPTDLHQTLYDSPRQAFEYYFPNLCVLPLRDFSLFAPAMRRQRGKYSRWGTLTTEEEAVADAVFALLDAEGGSPLRTRAHGAEHGHTRSGWGARTRVMSHVTDKLWLHGRLGIARRDNFERAFDRIERLFSAETLASPLPDEETERRLLAHKRLRARRLFRARREDVKALEPDALLNVQIEGVKRPWQILAEDAEALRNAESLPLSDDVFLLAPLDPLVYDRERNRDLFNFDYTWEVYTPEAKRRWGYYALPILQGERLIGRVDPKIDRKSRTLTLHALHLEPGVDPEDVAQPLAVRIRAFARWLGAEQIILAASEHEALRTAIEGGV